MTNNKVDINKIGIDVFFVGLGSMIFAFSIASILKPSGLMTGGITGISILVDKMFGLNYTYVYYIQSLSILLAAFIFLGKKEALKIITMSFAFPATLILFDRYSVDFVQGDLVLSSIYYGIIGGFGFGLILKRGYSVGGTDSLGKILHKKLFPFTSLSQIILVVDTIIVIASAFVFDRNIALYAILTQVVFMKVVDAVLFGITPKIMKVEIISNHYQEISEYILTQLKRGTSMTEITGGYTNQKRIKLVSLCSPRDVMLVKAFIAKCDPNALVDVCATSAVWGKGTGFQNLEDLDY
ncbi:Uncharacterized membrane-anchored protein YitT, contains DUF161 and DUF2179 domains [Peptoclostridium litorale DSM 5388]|uniref:DUF2179 domain-containing protein n=1 Tax=Peptoclostridium litorale DSM 5388 TaxID=1121324 RepID=A0A069RI43_PEPLI|nr:YitT family protein [Peptoclostridium litorale]KDR96468.1 hypothetical protein CLIT_2c00740 [Peptoclostridium litorale DSM 5388]SIN70240.1 Uncharacterized membrane-anchored protein YitT, contains DUF161 and DUF2179 domains [Peptoclostridium litorale DSM 5388]